MRVTRIIATIGVALLCSLASSCSKEEPDLPYGESFWAGNYPVQMLNSDTGELEGHMGCITLEFNFDASECVVDTGSH